MGEREGRVAQEVLMRQAGSGICPFHFIGQDIPQPLQKEWRSGKYCPDMRLGVTKTDSLNNWPDSTVTAKNNENVKHS